VQQLSKVAGQRKMERRKKEGRKRKKKKKERWKNGEKDHGGDWVIMNRGRKMSTVVLQIFLGRKRKEK
jgi:hypothetical protein